MPGIRIQSMQGFTSSPKPRAVGPVPTFAGCILGGLAGAVATWPMTELMSVLHRHLPAHERYPLPPRQITMNVASKMGVASQMDESDRFTTTMLAHYGYGAAVGAIFAALPQRDRLGVIARGLLFGAGVWTASYLGFLPSAGLLPSATRQPIRRSALMIAAHLVWGVTLAFLEQRYRAPRAITSHRPPLPD